WQDQDASAVFGGRCARAHLGPLRSLTADKLRRLALFPVRLKETTMFGLKTSTTFLALVAAGLMAGCASGVKLDKPAPVETRNVTPADGTQGQGQGAAESQVANVDLGKGAGGAAGKIDRKGVVWGWSGGVGGR